MTLPETVSLRLGPAAYAGTDRRAAGAPRVSGADRTSRTAWSLRAIFRNHPFPAVPGPRSSSLRQDEEASR